MHLLRAQNGMFMRTNLHSECREVLVTILYQNGLSEKYLPSIGGLFVCNRYDLREKEKTIDGRIQKNRIGDSGSNSTTCGSRKKMQSKL